MTRRENRLRSHRALALVLVLSVVSPLAAAAPAHAADKKARLTGYDALAVTGGRALLRFKVERDLPFIKWDLKGVTVEFLVGGQTIGTAVSADDGYADLAVTIGQTAGNVFVRGRIAAGQQYATAEATLLLAIRTPQTRVVITDIDHTISAASWHERLWKSNASLPPVQGAVAAIHDIDDDATVVYLTARDDGDARKTKSWLAHWGFPRGPVYFSDGIAAWFDPRPYKSATVRLLHAMFSDMPVGFGDLVADANAYNDNGLEAFIFDTHDAGPYPSFAHVYDHWDALRAANAAGLVPELQWARSFK
jgi:hypothetical protein